MAKLGLNDLDVRDKRVLVRVDFNVPLAGERVVDDARIRGALPTIRYLLQQDARVILMSHLGRPQGRPVDALRLDPVAKRVAELLQQPVPKLDDCVGESVEQAVSGMQPGACLLLENLRFHAGEEANDPEFSRSLARLADVYVNDAFGAAHRAHASTEGVARLLPAAAGFLLQREIEIMGKALEDPERPFVAILGGAKVSDKIALVRRLISRVDTLIIGGGMAYTFLKAQGYGIGRSLLEADRIPLAGELMQEAAQHGTALLLPVDVVAAEEMTEESPTQVVSVGEIPETWQGLDIGPVTRERFSEAIAEARTVLWNGPMGVFEMAPFAEGTYAVARSLAKAAAVTIIGGGDSAAAVEQAGVAQKMTHVSTGGGAALEFLEGRDLPGVAALSDKEE